MAVSKLSLILGGAFTVGAPSVAVGIWQIYESSKSPANNLISSEGLTYKPITAEFKGGEQIDTGSTDNRCVKLFGESFSFPFYQVPNEEYSSDGSSLTTPTSSSSKVIGCSFLRLFNSPSGGGNSNNEGFMINFFLSFRHDNLGMSLHAKGKYNLNSSGNLTQKLDYTLALLEKSGSEGKIKGGYSWFDAALTDKSKVSNDARCSDVLSSSFSSTPYIKTVDFEWNNGSSISEEKTYYYAGLGTEDNDGKGILEEIKIQKDSEGTAEIFGATEFSSQNAGYKKVKSHYYVDSSGDDSKGKKQSSSSTDISPTLTSGFEPFKEKKGKWTKFDDYCKGLLEAETLSEEQKENLRLFCVDVSNRTDSEDDTDS